MNKSMMFKKAHAIARKINSKVGNYAIAFKFALKKVWQMVKAGHRRITRRNMDNAIYDLTHMPVETITLATADYNPFGQVA